MTDSPSGRAPALGSLRSCDGKGIVRIEDRFDTDIDDVWSALADPERLARWLGRFEGDLRVGGGFRARFFASEWEGTGHVEVCDPPRHLLVRTTESGATGQDVIEIRLSAAGEQTVFVVEQRGLPREQLAAYAAGLQIHVEDLAAYLVGGERCDGPARWKELVPHYQAKRIEET